MIPLNFSSVGLRNRVPYKDLSAVELTAEEKTFLANKALGITKYLTWDTEEFSIVSRICNRYHIPFSSMKGWKERIEKGKMIRDKGGRPPSMDAEAGAQFVATLKARQVSKDAVPIAETHMLLGQAVNQTKLREGKRGLSAISEICVNTRKKFYKLYDVVTLKPQILTDARLKSCLCPRLSYIWGCVLMAYSSALMAENKWNADATTIIVSQKGTGSMVCVIPTKDDDVPVSSSSIPDTLNLLVKWFGLNNAGGEAGPLVLVFAVPSMTENTFFATKVLSMSSTSTIGAMGWIYFSKTRGGCYNMWVHYYLNVTIPTIRQSNELHLHTVRS